MSFEEWIELLKAIAPIVAAAMSAWALIQTKITHHAVNSRMDTLLKIAEAKASAEATLAEKAVQAIKDTAKEIIISKQVLTTEKVPGLDGTKQ